MPKPVVIIPSIRTIDARNIAAIPDDVDILVVDDSDGSIKPTRERMRVFTYADQREVMGRDYDLIPHKTAACRNFAFYYVYKHTDHDLIITIDDDCLLPAHFMAAYGAIGTNREWPNITVDGWYNTIAFLGVTGAGSRPLYPRGFPYWLRRPAEETRGTANGRLVCLMGLWANVLDYDGIDKYLSEDYRLLHQTVAPLAPVMTVGTPATPTKFSFCAMNFAFHRDMLPAAYQMPMDREILPGYPIWRFDDIWAGYVIEALVHKRGGRDVIGIGEEILASQRHMLLRNAKPWSEADDARMTGLYQAHLRQMEAWIARQRHLTALYVSYNELLTSPREQADRVNAFLGGTLDVARMISVVDENLYRQKR